ncbi:SusC/RagA family TonB-linked outer membrane protein [uncultured Croceitalea sp.]|uniref:SusC/RagA family TonB-linked outer membrane protein n=1 Tax=uncultured Croceitalea sp. TaxID=1798908 RepID=UPI00330607AF
MKQKLKFLSVLLALMVATTVVGQEKSISGNVTDQSGLPLPGVSIVVVGTTTGTQTDFDGNYIISATLGQVLRFSYIGQTTVNRTVGNASVINIQMQEDAQALDEVVVQGYRTATKATSSIAISTISAETITNRPNASVLQTLSGQVPGLNITASSGQPGAAPRINLRGVGSINGNTDPLYIIDGAPVDANAFRSLGNNDIESVSVLKDAGATAIYGNRGANGVVIIKTRQGSYNQKLQITYSGITEFSNLQDIQDYNLLDSRQQLQLERDQSTGLGNGLTDAEIGQFSTTQWAEVFFRTSATQQHTVSLSSGSENFTQFTSLQFRNQPGILLNTGLTRFNFRNNLTGKSDNDKFNFSSNIAIGYSQNDELNNIGTAGINRNVVLGAFQSLPYLNPADLGTGAEILAAGNFFPNTPFLLLDLINTFERREDELQILGNFDASYKIWDGLRANIRMSGEYRQQILNRTEFPNSFNALIFAGPQDPPGFQEQDYEAQFLYNQVTSLTYNKLFGKHTIDAGAYIEYFRGFFSDFGFFADGLVPALAAAGDGSAFVPDNPDNDLFVDTINANRLTSGLFSYFFQGDYDYDKRFGIAGTIRRDASFRFSESNRFGTFGSVAARWNISEENWFGADSFVDNLKLRASWGVTGNQFISNTAPRGINFDAPDLTRDLFVTNPGYGGQNALFLNQIGNNTLQWETTQEINIGLDFGLFSNRLRGSVDVYDRTTSDLFLSAPISPINVQEVQINANDEFPTLSTNSGEIKNSGIDLSLTYDLVRSKDFNLSINLIGNYNKQEIIDLPTDNGEIINPGGIGAIGLQEGGLINEYFLVRYAGVNPDNGNLLFLDANGNETENPDVDTDRVFLGTNLAPDYQGSFGFDLNYKGLFLSTQWNYAIGVDRLDNDLAGFSDPSNIGTFRATGDLLRAWTPDNTDTDVPSLTATNIALDGNSDRFLQSADFLRLRFATAGYDVPKKFIEKTGLTRARIFVQGENLLTFTPWRGFDPETVNTFDPGRSRLYPTPKVFSVGLEVGF